MEILHDKLPSMPEKIAIIFHHNFYSKPKVDLKVGDISQRH